MCSKGGWSIMGQKELSEVYFPFSQFQPRQPPTSHRHCSSHTRSGPSETEASVSPGCVATEGPSPSSHEVLDQWLLNVRGWPSGHLAGDTGADMLLPNTPQQP